MRPRVKLNAAVLMTYRVSCVMTEQDFLVELSSPVYTAMLRTAQPASKYAVTMAIYLHSPR